MYYQALIKRTIFARKQIDRQINNMMVNSNALKMIVTVLLTLSFSASNLLHANICKNTYSICSENWEIDNWCADNTDYTNGINENTSEKENTSNDFQKLYQEGKLYVKLHQGNAITINEQVDNYILKTPFANLINQYEITKVERAFSRLPQMDAYLRIYFNRTDLTEQLIAAIKQLKVVEYAERVPAHYTFLTPNDIHPDQYNVLITQAEQAWDLTLGSSDIVIGMVDDAVLLDHEDLAANIWINLGEIAGNGIDDDGNGYIDDMNGWDAASNDNDPNPEGAVDNFTFSHGTHCAGIAAGVTDNGIGVASVSFNVKQMGIKTALSGSGAIDAGMGGVEYAIAAGADVISMSWGGGAEAATEQAVFDLAHDQGIVLVAAAGNDNSDIPMFPASYNHVISVGASDNADNKAGFSNYGATIDVMAPGVNIYSPVATNNSAYEFYDGTSMACPYVSGLAALMLSLDPSATPDRIEQCLKETADDIYPLNPGFEDQLGAGRVNAYLAVQCTPSEPTASYFLEFSPPCAGETVTFFDNSLGTDLFSWEWSFPGATPSSSTDVNPSVSFPSDGDYIISLTVTNDLGAHTLTDTITVAPPHAIISGDNVIFLGYIVPLEFNFTGSPPYTFTYTDGTNSWTESGINENPYEVQVAPFSTTSYEITAFSNGDCVGTFEGNPEILVIAPTETNDECENALPFPILEVNEQSCVLGSTSEANGELPYINQSDCAGVAAPVPAADVWYSFEAVANILLVDLTFDMDTVVISFYEGTCDGLIGRGCDIGTGGTFSTSFAPTAAGTTYYVQVSGGSLGDTGDFTLCLENNGETEEEICMLGQTLVVTPTPILGAYTPGQMVDFCFTVEDYNTNAVDWFHGLVPVFGSGWDISTLTNITPPPTCEGSAGEWDWYDSVQGQTDVGAIIGPQGPGFFFEKNGGFGDDPTDPGDNFGDAGADGCSWEFCFTIATKATCPPGVDGEDLSIRFLNFSDSETGDWNVTSICPDDPEYLFKAVLSCCAIPLMDGVDASCADPESGEITATVTTGSPPFNFEWSNGETFVDNTTSTIDSLGAGFYTLTITDNEGCVSEASYTIIQSNTGLVVDIIEEQTICKGNTVELFASIPDAETYQWGPGNTLSATDIPNPIASPQDTTEYIVIVTDASGCSNYAQVMVNVVDNPPVDAGENVVICPGESAQLFASGGFGFSWTPTASLDAPTFPNPVATPTETTTYYVDINTGEGCNTVDSVTVYVAPLPYFPVESVDTTICPNDTLVLQLTDQSTISNNYYEWSPTAGLDASNIANPTATITESIEYTVTVTNQYGCQAIETIAITIGELNTEIDLGADTILCDNNTLTLSTEEVFATYLWSDGSTNQTLLVSEAGEYSLTVTDSGGCPTADTILVTYENIVPNIVGDLNIAEGQTSILSTDLTYDFYEWSTGETTASITVNNAGDYAVTTSSVNGCFGADEVRVNVAARNELLIPNAFSPNGDGINDEFAVYNSNQVENYNCLIYNRWGVQVFSTTDFTQAWNGRYKNEIQPLGVYVYIIQVEFIDGTEKIYKGNLSLIQ